MLTLPPRPLQVYICEQQGLQQVADYWHSVVKINDFQKQRFVGRMIDAMFNTISGKKIAVLGFAFKKDTGDTRETPAIDVCRGLLEDNAQVTIYDPQVSLQIALLGMLIAHQPSTSARFCWRDTLGCQLQGQMSFCIWLSCGPGMLASCLDGPPSCITP